MSYFTARAPHHLPVGERGLCAIETVEAKGIAAQWMSPAQVGISAFATAFLLYPKVLVEAVCDVRALLAQGGAYELRLLLVHLQGLCQTRGIAHRDGESDPAFWCWCQPYEEARHPHVAAAL